VIRRLRGQEGFAIPIAIWMLTLGLLFGGLAMSQALLGLRKANSSWNTTRAHAAAEAAMRMAVYSVNTLGLNGAAVTHLTSALDWTQCAAKASASDPVATIGITAGNAWCDAVPIDLGGGVTASFQLSSIVNCNVEMGYNPLPSVLSLGTIQDCLKRRIVATGTAGGVTRRIYEDARATATANVVGALGINVIGSVSLQLAKPVPGTLHECPPIGGTASDPSAGC
jgi:Tfp pilus assembly protein PilX